MASSLGPGSVAIFRIAATALALCVGCVGSEAAEPAPVQHAATGTTFRPADVDYARPVYRTEFDDPAELRNWVLEGGKSMSIVAGRLVLESSPAAEPGQRSSNHLVCWLKQEVPADFLFETVLRPQNKREGLNIVFFNTRGVKGQGIFDPSLAPRDGVFAKYHSGDLNGYHVSYWAPPRPTTHIRKNFGFHQVATSDLDLIAAARPETFETLRIYKRGPMIRVMIGDTVLVAWDDDGKTFGPVHQHTGWIGLRQMGHTLRCEYERVAIYPLRVAPK